MPLSTSSSSSDEKVTSGKDASDKTLVDTTLAARYAETMKRHSRLGPDNNPSMSSRVLLLGLVGLLFYYALRSKLDLRLMKAQLDVIEYDKDYTRFMLEEA